MKYLTRVYSYDFITAGEFMNYSALNAKIAGMSAKLLSNDDYLSLCSSRSIHDVYTKLKSYSSYYGMADNGTSTPQQLYLLLDSDFKKIQVFINDNNTKKYLDSLYMKREISVIKQLLSAIYHGRNYEYMLFSSRIFKEGYAVSFSRTEDFIEALRSSRIQDILKSIYKPGIALSEIETSLDLQYYTNLWKAKNRFLKGVNKDIAGAVNGTEIDLQNITRIYRLKIYYKPMKEYIYRYMLPINYKLSPEVLMQLIETESESNLPSLIKNTCYGAYFSKDSTVESFFYETLVSVYECIQKRHQNSIAPIIYYLFRKETEIKNVISILEGINYSMDSSEIMGSVRVYTQ